VVGPSGRVDSIICLLVVEGTAGLFHRAILFSPPLRELKDRTPTASLLSQKAEQLFTKEPREMSVDEMLGVQKRLLLNPVQTQVTLFAPTLQCAPLSMEQDLIGGFQRLLKAAHPHRLDCS